MSTKRKAKPGVSFLDSFLTRQHDLGEHHANIMMITRLMREWLANGDATPQAWIEVAGIFNVCGMFAQHRQRMDWFDSLVTAAQGLKEIELRVRAGALRYAAELEQITAGLNLIDGSILPQMTAMEWNHFAAMTNQMFEAYAA